MPPLNTGVYLLPYDDDPSFIDFSGFYSFVGTYTFNNNNILNINAFPHGVPDNFTFVGSHRFGDGHLFSEVQGIYTVASTKNATIYTGANP